MKTLTLYQNPASPYCQKVLFAFKLMGFSNWNNEIVNLFIPEHKAAYAQVNPLQKIPYLSVIEKGMGMQKIHESSIIVEYVQNLLKEQCAQIMIPRDQEQALQVRMWDRMLDMYLHDPLAQLFFQSLRRKEKKNTKWISIQTKKLNAMYGLLNERLDGKTFFVDELSLADCSLLPGLYFAKNLSSYQAYPHLWSYADRMLKHPDFLSLQDDIVLHSQKIMQQLQTHPV